MYTRARPRACCGQLDTLYGVTMRLGTFRQSARLAVHPSSGADGRHFLISRAAPPESPRSKRRQDMPGFYLYFRCWPGFTDHFPFEKFNGLPDSEIQEALDKFARHWKTKNQAKLDARKEVRRRRDLGQPMIPTQGQTNAVSKSTRQRLPLIYEIGPLAGWITSPTIVDAIAPIPREFFLRIDGKEVAAQVVEVMQERMSQAALVPRFGYVPEDDLEITERVSIELAIDDVQQGIGAGPLSSRERIIAIAAKRVTEKLELIKTRAERTGDGESVQPGKASFVVGSKRVMTDGQKRLWDALHERALTGKELAAETELDSSEETIRQWVSELRKAEYEIDNRRGRGYFRPDAPPADFETPTAM